jgi:hypothetical protein
MAEFDICRWRTEEEQEGVRAAMTSRGIPNYGVESIDLSKLMDFSDIDPKVLGVFPNVTLHLTGEVIE